MGVIYDGTHAAGKAFFHVAGKFRFEISEREDQV